MTKAIDTVGVIAPGDMGHAVGATLRRHGLRVITVLAGRSARTRALAAAAGIEDAGRDAALIAAADIVLSIVVPAQAQALAERLTPAFRAAGRTPLYVDCNAIAPGTVRRIGALIEAAGGRFVDAGIIGPPPKPGRSDTRFYASGPVAADFARLSEYGLDVRVIGDRAGEASAVKMCYAALTKGTTALMTELAVAAERLGVSEVLRAEFALSQPTMLERMGRAVPAMVPKAHRWVGEMEEIAKTFAAVGLTPRTFEGAAELYAFIAGTAAGRTSPEDWRRRGASFEALIRELAGSS